MELAKVDNKRITKNAAVLYFRMAVTMFVSFYTSRIILQVLGVVDFGIYNVVYGVTMIVTFFSGSLMNVAQRYLSLGIGANDLKKTNNYFNQFVSFFSVISLLVFIIGESFSVWVIESLLSIPSDRIAASHWAYQSSLCALVLGLVQIPFQASVIANERMGVFAFLTLFETFARLGILFVVNAVNGDNLIQYSLLLFLVSLIIFCSYLFYCIRQFKECKLKLYFNKGLALEMSSFIGYNFFGCFAFSMSQQGVNVLLNVFFGPAINAARAVAMQIYLGIYRFSDSILVAVRPPIIKLYAQNEIDKMINLFINTSRYCLFINTLLVLPVIFNTNFILRMWLGNVPSYTKSFIVIVLIESYFNIMNQIITILVNATGNLKRNQLYGRTYTLLILPLAYLMLQIIRDPLIPVVFTVVGSMLYFFNNLYDVHLQIGVDIKNYIFKVLIPIFLLHLPLILAYLIVSSLLQSEWIRFVFTSFIFTIFGIFLIYSFMLTKEERKFADCKVKEYFKYNRFHYR